MSCEGLRRCNRAPRLKLRCPAIALLYPRAYFLRLRFLSPVAVPVLPEATSVGTTRVVDVLVLPAFAVLVVPVAEVVVVVRGLSTGDFTGPFLAEPGRYCRARCVFSYFASCAGRSLRYQ